MRICFILILATFTSCQPKDVIVEPQACKGMATASINGEDYDFSACLMLQSGKYHLALEHAEMGTFSKNICFRQLDDTKAIQNVFRDNIDNKDLPEALFHTKAGDVAGNYYLLNEKDLINDYLQFTFIDENSQKFRGIFQTSFIIYDTSAAFDPTSPDTLVVEHGYFEAGVVR